MKDILFSFNTIFDIEFGLYKLIIKEYDEEYFKFVLEDDVYLKTIIMFRDNPNPLSKIVTEKTKDNMDKLFQDFMKNKYDDILDNCCTTDLIVLVNSLRNTNRFNPMILCKNKKEEQLCIEKNLNPVLYEDTINWNELSEKYDVMYFRYFEELDLLQIQGKNIYFSNTIFNIINKDKLVSVNNTIRLIDLYRL